MLNDGTVKCWGRGSSGQLGYDSTDNKGDQAGEMASLGTVNLGATATAISAGHTHTCALLNNGGIKCWGHNAKGQLGIGSKSSKGKASGDMASLGLVDLGTAGSSGAYTAVQVAAGYQHTCAILNDGSVKCWGAGGDGALGSGATDDLGDSTGEMANSLPLVNLGSSKTAVALSLAAELAP